MAQPKPRKGWTPLGSTDKQYFSVDGLKKILTNANVTVHSSMTDKDLEKIANDLDYATDWCFCTKRDRPTPAEKKAGLKNLKRRADALESAMKELDYDSKHYHLLWNHALDEPIEDDPKFFEATQHNVLRLKVLSETAIKYLDGGKRGPRKNSALDCYLNRLDGIYPRITHKTRGFIAFAIECLKHIGQEPPQSRNALKQRRYEIRKKKRQARSPSSARSVKS